MPLYEYQCNNCGKRFEVRQNFSDAPLTTHEECGGPVERLISVPALQFKGSGWYITDYARSGGSSSAPNGGNKAEGSKPETKKTESGTSSAPSTSSTPPSGSK